MAKLTFSLVPASPEPILGTDSVLTSRDGLRALRTTLAKLPISDATQVALNTKQATLVSGTNIKTIAGISLLGAGDIPIDISVTKEDIGLGNVDNTSDLNKPISTLTQTALDGKQPVGTYATSSDLTSGLATKANSVHTHTISDVVGLQTSLDSKDTATSVNTKISDLSTVYEPINPNIQSHIASIGNPHSVTKSQVGLGLVDNTSDLNKPISTLTQTALDLKANQATTYTKTESELLYLKNPAGITRPCESKGKKLAGFAAADNWLLFTGNVEGTNCITTNDVTNIDNITGLPTGPVSPDGTSLLKKFEILTNGNVGIKKIGMSVNINGMIGFWVYIGKPTSGNVKMHIGVSTAGTGPSNDFNFTNNAVFPDQWNFIVIARSADATSNTNVEAHPFGLVETIYDYTQCRFKTQPLTRIDITCEDMAGSTLYFASAMYDWDTMPQFVLGGDSSGQYTRDIVLPKFKQYGWVGYIAETFRLSFGEVSDWDAYGTTTYLDEVYAEGWDIVSHTVNHLNATAAYPTNAGMARYEATASKSWLASLGYTRGNDFYVSPQGATNRLVTNVIKNAGYKLQRHGSHDVTQVTPNGVMNPDYIGSLDIGGNGWLYGATSPYQFNYSQIDNLRIWVDMVIKYKGTAFPFWHVVRVLGDPGDGRGVPPDTITMYKSTFDLFMEHVALRESQGLCRVVDGFTGFYYGSGR